MMGSGGVEPSFGNSSLSIAGVAVSSAIVSV
jgi:hypothetical protein